MTSLRLRTACSTAVLVVCLVATASGVGLAAEDSPVNSYRVVRDRLLKRQEIAFLDVREEIPHADGHPLFAASLPISTIEMNAFTRLPRRQVPIVVLDRGEGLAERAANTFTELGYSDVHIFEGGVDAWAAAGGELFKDINVPSKAFGEFMEARARPPLMTPEAVNSLRKDGKAVVLDVRRPDEHEAFCIPGAVSVPGAEVVLQIADLVPDETTQVIVHCAGRTRGLIWAQALRNAGIRNPVATLKNGTIGWTMAGLPLEPHQKSRNQTGTGKKAPSLAAAARRVADRAQVKRARWDECLEWERQDEKTTYFFDVRSHEEYVAGHLPNWRHAPGGELVQELMMKAPVRGARIVLVDDDGVRANMTASWLAQMNCDVSIVDDPPAFSTRGDWVPVLPPQPDVPRITARELAALPAKDCCVIDISPYREYVRGHVPGAWFALRSEMKRALAKIPSGKRFVLTDQDGRLAAYAVPEMTKLATVPVHVLDGGNRAWTAARMPLEKGPSNVASPPIDRFQRPYEAPAGEADVTFDHEAIEKYIAWLSGSDLLEQIRRDGTAGFVVY